MNIEGRTIRLRAVEPGDVDLMYEWENDCDIWPVSGTTEPFSRHQLERFVERHQDIVGVLCDGQLRLIIETLLSSKPVGAIDLFEYDPIHRRAGVGILIYERSDRGRGYASEALRAVLDFALNVVGYRSVTAKHAMENPASGRVMQKAGMSMRVGEILPVSTSNGFFNCVVYEIRRPRKKGLFGSPKKPAAFYRIRTS